MCCILITHEKGAPETTAIMESEPRRLYLTIWYDDFWITQIPYPKCWSNCRRNLCTPELSGRWWPLSGLRHLEITKIHITIHGVLSSKPLASMNCITAQRHLHNDVVLQLIKFINISTNLWLVKYLNEMINSPILYTN